MNDDKTKTGDSKTDNKATGNGDQQTAMSRDDLLKMLAGDPEKAPTAKDEVAELKMEMAVMRAEKAISKQFPNLPEETVMQFAELAGGMDAEQLQQFTANLTKLAEVKTDEKETNKALPVDAAGSTSKDGDAGGDSTPAMGPQSWGSAVDLAFV